MNLVRDKLTGTIFYVFGSLICGWWAGLWLALVNEEGSFREMRLKYTIVSTLCYIAAIYLFYILIKFISYAFLISGDLLFNIIPDFVGISFLGSLFVILIYYVPREMLEGGYNSSVFRWFSLTAFFTLFSMAVMGIARFIKWLLEQ
jgi:hypothetical protein